MFEISEVGLSEFRAFAILTDRNLYFSNFKNNIIINTNSNSCNFDVSAFLFGGPGGAGGFVF